MLTMEIDQTAVSPGWSVIAGFTFCMGIVVQRFISIVKTKVQLFRKHKTGPTTRVGISGTNVKLL